MKGVRVFGVALRCFVVQDRYYRATCGLLTAAVVAVWLRRRTGSRSWMLRQRQLVLVHVRR